MNLFPWFLFAHVLGAIIAFGPTFSSPIIGRMGAAERAHGNFAMRLSRQLARVQIIPLALLQGITGVALIVTGNIDLFARYWLLVAIVLYLIAIGFAIFIQVPRAKRIIEMTMPPADGAAAGAPAGGPPAGGPPAGLMREITLAKRGGYLLIVLVTSIVFLMVVKPF
jgi:hypothetical protein